MALVAVVGVCAGTAAVVDRREIGRAVSAIKNAEVQAVGVVEEPPRADARSRLHELLRNEFIHGGWPDKAASIAANWALVNRLKRGIAPYPDMPPGAKLDPRSSVHSLAISGLERCGWDALEASLMATEILEEFTALFSHADFERSEYVLSVKKPILDSRSSEHALLTSAFVKGGWPTRDASMAATWSLKNLLKPGRSPPPNTPVGATLDPRVSVHALLIDDFVDGGWTREDASLLVARKLSAYMALPRSTPFEAKCAGQRVTIVFCSGQDHRKLDLEVKRACFETIFGTSGSGPCAFEHCNGSQKKYLSLTTSGTCASELPAGCVWAYFDPEPVEVDCDTAMDCACFVETNPLDCEDIEEQCCGVWPATCGGCSSCG